MANSVKDLLVRILVDDSDVEKFKKAGESAHTFGDDLDKAAGVSAGVLALLAGGAAVTAKAAADLEQSAGGVDAVFGQFADHMHENADAAATAVGLSANSYNEFATVLGAQLKNAGVPMDQLGGKTEDLIGKAADLAATFGGTTADAVEAISSAMKGEMDPIEKYGISLNQAMLQQQAAAMGIEGSSATWDNATKQQVILAAITKQGGDAWGQFAAQSGTAAEQQQIAQASIETASAQIGGVFLPIMAKGAEYVAQFGQWAAQNAGTVQLIGGIIAGLAATILLVAGAVKVWSIYQAVMNTVQAIQTSEQWANNAAWLASPVTWIVLGIIAAIALLVAAGIWLYENWDSVTQFLGSAFSAAGDWIMSIGNGIATWWNGLWTGISDTFSNIWNGIIDFFKGVINGYLGLVGGLANGIIGLINGAIDGINSISVDIPSWVPLIGGQHWGLHIPHIPTFSIPALATGGIITAPTIALVGEAGPEAVVPLSSGFAQSALGGSDGPVEVSLTSESARMVARELFRMSRNGGRDGGVAFA